MILLVIALVVATFLLATRLGKSDLIVDKATS
jgi:hypothetical protein